MRDLPDSASIDHLRQQAKDLLAVLRASEPDATLHDAQASLARQHGFDHWADLKAEVERRHAAPRRTSTPDLADRLAAAYGLGTPAAPMTHVERQWAGEVWELTTDGGRWLLTELAGYVTPAAIEIQQELIERAMAAGILAPPPVRSTAGPFVVELEGAAWQAHGWLQLGPPPPQPPPDALAREGGRMLATLHRLRLPPPGQVVPWLTQRHDEAHWAHVVDRARTGGAVWADDLAAAVSGFLALDTVRDDRDPNDRAILSKAWHAPIGTRIAGPDRLVAVGWEHAGPVPPDWELGASLMAWSETIEAGYHLPAATAFLDGYREASGEPVEVTLAMFTSGVTAALNWTISRANIALDSDDAVERGVADRTIRTILRNPLTLASVRELAEAVA